MNKDINFKNTTLLKRIEDLNWKDLNTTLLDIGYVVTPPFLTKTECNELINSFTQDELFRSTIDMKRYNFGKGTYRYFNYPLPVLIQSLREEFYELIVDTANLWSERLKYKDRYPKKFSSFKAIMKEKNQTRPTPLILRYKKDDFNCLHQDISNDLIFPFQMVIGLSEKGKDYSGGQLILTQQRPRMQTIPHIITIPKGAAVIFTSNFHPQQGSRGFYRSVFKHGVGKIIDGERFTLGIVFHDYKEKLTNIEGNDEY